MTESTWQINAIRMIPACMFAYLVQYVGLICFAHVISLSWAQQSNWADTVRQLDTILILKQPRKTTLLVKVGNKSLPFTIIFTVQLCFEHKQIESGMTQHGNVHILNQSEKQPKQQHIKLDI